MDALKLDKSLLKNLIITVVYALVTGFCVLHHEIWSDEAQVWLIGQNLSFFGLFKHLVNEGHPSFFYLLTMPFAKIFGNIIWLQIICWLASVLAVFCLWNFSRFSTYAKIFITISAPFLYFFPVIARSYSIIPILVFLLAILHQKTKEHPYLYATILIALANTHVIMFGFCCLLALWFAIDNVFKSTKKEYIISGSIMILGLLAVVIQLIGTTSSNVAITFHPAQDNFATFVRVVMLFLYNSFDDYIIKSSANYFTVYPVTMTILTILTYAFCLVMLFLNNKKLFIVFFLSASSQAIIYTLAYSYFIFPTRVYCLYVILLFCFWVALDYNKALSSKKNKLTNIAVSILFFLTMINCVKSYYGDINFDYTSSKRVATFIRNNTIKDKAFLVTDSIGFVGSVVYYLSPDYDLYSIYDAKPIRYLTWNKEALTLLSPNQWLETFKNIRTVQKDKDLYAIINFNPFCCLNLVNLDEEYFDLIFVSPNGLMPNETFKIYKYKK